MCFSCRAWPPRNYFRFHIVCPCRTTLRPHVGSQHGRLCVFAQQSCFHHCACGLFDGCCGGAVSLCSRIPTAASKLKRCRTNRWTRAAGACFLTCLVRRRVL